jgi:methylated-DNA-[protein]-cysteine S-methyltransferase
VSEALLKYRVVESPIGKIHLYANEHGLVGLYTDTHRDPLPTNKVDVEEDRILNQAAEELVEYFEGKRREFAVPVDPQGTKFQRSVWSELQRIPCGETITYGALAKRLGDPLLTRAVGTANGQNPVSIIIPCHRVIGANGHLTGYAGGLEIKRWLIDHEAEDRLF